VREVLLLGPYDPANHILLDISVVEKYAMCLLWQTSAGKNIRKHASGFLE
jgi:hypothetical protein